MAPAALERARLHAPRVVALLAFALYAIAAPPGLYWLDSGELSGAGIGLGISHPTGFPLPMALVKLASLLPLGELAFRVNLLSAACAALAVLWVARLVVETADDLAAVVGAVAAGATLALSLTFFRQATVAEVYAPNAALMALAFLHAQRVAAGGGARAGLLLALVCGLGLGGHITFGLLGPPVLALYLLRLRRGARWTLAAPLLVALAAAALYLYLPTRAAAGVQPEIQWEQTDQAAGFAAHVTGARIRGAFADEMGSRWSASAVEFLGEMGDQLMLALVAAAAGAIWLARRRRTRWLGVALGAAASGDFLYSTALNPMGQVDLQNGIPFALCACAAAGAGVAWLARALGRAGPWAGGAATAIMIVPVVLVSWSEVWAASSGDLPRRFAETGLAAAPTGAIAMVESDSVAAALIYLATAESARPDVAIVVRQQMALDWRIGRILSRGSRESDSEDSRPRVWEPGSTPLPSHWTLQVGPVLGRVHPDAAAAGSAGAGGAANEIATAGTALIDLFDHPSRTDRSARIVLANALDQLGKLAFARGDHPTAEACFTAAIASAPTMARPLVNRGALRAARGDLAGALADTEAALALAPDHVTALINAARFYIQRNDDSQARARIDHALALAPDRASALAISAILHARAGDLATARAQVDRALAIDPDARDARDADAQLRRSGH